MHTVRRACSALPSRTLLRGHPARNAGGTLGLLRVAALAPTGPHTHGHKAPWGRGALYSTVAAEEAVPTKKKVWDSVEEAIQDVKSGDIVLSGGACYINPAPMGMWAEQTGCFAKALACAGLPVCVYIQLAAGRFSDVGMRRYLD